MQEIRYDGSQVLTDSATKQQILQALGDPTNKVVALHKPGSAVTLPDGSEFVAQVDGTWARMAPDTKTLFRSASQDFEERIDDLRAKLAQRDPETPTT